MLNWESSYDNNEIIVDSDCDYDYDYDYVPKGTRVLVTGFGFGTVLHQYPDLWLVVEFDDWFAEGHSCKGFACKGYGEYIWPEDVTFGVAIIED